MYHNIKWVFKNIFYADAYVARNVTETEVKYKQKS